VIRRIIITSFFVGFGSVMLSGVLLICALIGLLSQAKIGLYGVALLLCINLTVFSALLGFVLEYLLRIHRRLHMPNQYVNPSDDIYADKISSKELF
jgi:hypothetical protein